MFAYLQSLCEFQFQIGAIGSQNKILLTNSGASFNSRLVRLAVTMTFNPIDENHVSIPDWCDWQRLCNSSYVTANSVSIPDWCDWQLICLQSKLYQKTVSIPDWSDWQHVRRGARAEYKSFNSRLVRLAAGWKYYHKGAPRQFQFQIGPIGSINRFNCM